MKTWKIVPLLLLCACAARVRDLEKGPNWELVKRPGPVVVLPFDISEARITGEHKDLAALKAEWEGLPEYLAERIAGELRGVREARAGKPGEPPGEGLLLTGRFVEVYTGSMTATMWGGIYAPRPQVVVEGEIRDGANPDEVLGSFTAQARSRRFDPGGRTGAERVSKRIGSFLRRELKL